MVLGAKNRRRLLASGMEQFQDVVLLCFRRFQQEPFVQDEQNRIRIFGKRLLVAVFGASHFQSQKQVRKTDIFRLEPLLARFHTKSADHVGLSTSCGTGDEDVPMLHNVLAGGQPLNHGPGQFPAGGIVNRRDMCIWLVKKSSFDEASSGCCSSG